MTLALWQTPYFDSPGEALAQLGATAASAAADGADLLICPEMSLTGYAIGPERVDSLAESADGPLSQAVASFAQRHNIGIVYGYPERHSVDGKRPFNAAQAIGPDGRSMGHYRKTHLFGDLDRAQFSPGDAASQVFEWRGWQLGLLICYDVEFPEAVRDLALQGADAVLVPTANMAGFDEVPSVLVPARACENRLYVAYANACGKEGRVHYGGLSLMAGPDGRALAQAGHGTALLQRRLSRPALAQARTHDYLSQRRTDLYDPLREPSTRA
ncbi:hypothetical protein LPB72_10740 [Hydrogenophaga crassostreae]|uniref:CN hydrolase domain-containing protein n=1 Tax=Hydrogenophaga crassostreae TaxID=1763535 RepID=A0A163CGI4_9BURK|nr:hypothetical protein LPB072_12115 [Hydrogenophaga crassostreae]OAD42058.1 hypothetical protein LPB72_10740 [Hydrogenophaga crassostreae]